MAAVKAPHFTTRATLWNVGFCPIGVFQLEFLYDWHWRRAELSAGFTSRHSLGIAQA